MSCSLLVILDSSENDNDPLDRGFLKANRKIILLRSVNYDLAKLPSLINKIRTKKHFKKNFFSSSDVNFDISEIDNKRNS